LLDFVDHHGTEDRERGYLMLTLAALRLVVVGVAGFVLLFAAYAVASAPTRVASRLGMRGLKRRVAIENKVGWPQIEPIVRWLGVRVSGVLGDRFRNRLDAQIALAGDYLGLTAEEYVALSFLSCIGLGGIGALFAALGSGKIGLFVAIGATVGIILPYMQISGAAQKRLQGINEALPYVIDLMALAMSAGMHFPGAIRQVVEKSTNPEDPLVVELTRILRELSIGRTRKQALVDFASRAPTIAVTEFVAALIQAEEQGNPVAEVLLVQAGVARMRRSVRAEEAAAKAAVKMVGPLFLLFACIMMLVLGPMVLSLMEGG
jgi:tight adherence protein C